MKAEIEVIHIEDFKIKSVEMIENALKERYLVAWDIIKGVPKFDEDDPKEFVEWLFGEIWMTDEWDLPNQFIITNKEVLWMCSEDGCITLISMNYEDL